jgi:Flp pilus assembly protein TadG
MANFSRLFRNALEQTGRFRRNEGGTMALFVALSAIPIIFSVGAGIDYSTANMAKSKLDAVADAAALSAVDHNAISGTAAAAQITATNVFNAEAVNLKNVTMGPVTVTVTDANGGRTAVVSYTATKTNTFMGLMGIPSTTISELRSGPVGQHQFLPAARQFAIDEYCRDDRRHQHDGGQHLGARRLCLRLP